MSQIHSTAIVSPDARLGEGVEIGPFAIIGEGCEIGDGTVVGARATLERNVTSKDPLLLAVDSCTLDGLTVADPSLLVNGTSNLSPVQPTWT